MKIKGCPHCGCEEYYIKQRFKGNCEYRCRFDGKEAVNDGIHDNIEYTNTSRYAYCVDCNKRICLITDLE